jgi:hypothetical protein
MCKVLLVSCEQIGGIDHGTSVRDGLRGSTLNSQRRRLGRARWGESTSRCQLVQFFLNVSAQNNERIWGWLIDRNITKPNIDGSYGAINQHRIDRFQKYVNKKATSGNSWSIVADGRVDAIQNGISATSVGLPYTIYQLNVAYYSTFGANAISRAADHPLMPRELARSFMMHGRSR